MTLNPELLTILGYEPVAVQVIVSIGRNIQSKMFFKIRFFSKLTKFTGKHLC